MNMSDGIPQEAFLPFGECEFCGDEGPVAEVGFGVVLVDEETGNVVDEGDSCETRMLCPCCTKRVFDSTRPLEHMEAEIKGEIERDLED